MFLRTKQFFVELQENLLEGNKLVESDLEEIRFRRFTYFYFLITILFIGVPIWWFTTTPYRAHLPYFTNEFCNELNEFLSDSIENSSSTKDVWNQITLSSSYNIHFVIIDSPQNVEKNPLKVEKIIQNVNKFASIFAESFHLSLSFEHFWDFSLANFMENLMDKESSKKNLIDINSDGILIENRHIPALATEIDRLSTPSTNVASLFKIAIFEEDNKIKNLLFQDENFNNTSALAIASWGGFISIPNNNLENLDRLSINAIFSILRIQLGILSSRQKNFNKQKWLLNSAKNQIELEALKHQLDHTIQHLNKTVHFINSLHDLKSKIEDLVISDEVAKMAWQAHAQFFKAYNSLLLKNKKSIDSIAAARSQILAEKAVTHESLLEFLNFPSDQKYGVYVPLFLPVLIPMIHPIFLIAKFYFTVWMKKSKTD